MLVTYGTKCLWEEGQEGRGIQKWEYKDNGREKEREPVETGIKKAKGIRRT